MDSSSAHNLPQRIGFVGAGQMALALAQGFVRAGLTDGPQVDAYDVAPAMLERFATQIAGAKLASSNAQVVERAEVIFVAVKPQHLGAALGGTRQSASADKLFVSIVAGAPLTRLSELLGTQRVIRVMPNTPCLIGHGASAYCLAHGASDEDGRLVERLLQSVGVAFRLEEKLLDAVTGLSGSGPAFVYMMIEALSDGGVRMGLPREVSSALAAQTLYGAAAMVLQTKEHPGVLKDRVASPGGTTIAGIAALEERGLRGALIAAVEAATRRSMELGKS
jgi:pyrroline-5-carboxylate reductase